MMYCLTNLKVVIGDVLVFFQLQRVKQLWRRRETILSNLEVIEMLSFAIGLFYMIDNVACSFASKHIITEEILFQEGTYFD